MTNKDARSSEEQSNDYFEEQVASKARRRLSAQKRKDRDSIFWVGMFGLVGWSIAVPTVVGISLGIWVDRRWPGPVSWTLSFLFIGVIVGCFHAWYWIKEVQNDK